MRQRAEAISAHQRTDQHLRSTGDYLPSTCAGRTSAAHTDWHYSAGKTKAVMLGGLAHSAQRSSIKKQAAQHDRAVRQRHATALWSLAIAVLRIGH